MSVNRSYIWFLAILIGSFFGYYMVFKSLYSISQLRALVHNQDLNNTANPMERVATNTADIAGDDRLLIGHYVSRFDSVIGKEFNFDNSTLAVVRSVLRNQTFKRKPIEFIDAKMPFFDLVAPVTACSSNHYGEFKPHIEDFRKNFPGKKCYFYDLGLSDKQISEVRKMPDIVYRNFDFNAYPQHITNLRNYA